MRKQEEEAPLRVVGIVGRCGCGKTALAQKVFASPIVKKEFSPMIWVSLSNMLQLDDPTVGVVNHILKEIGRRDDRGVSNSDHSRLAEELQGKRYLIVLDNAWRLDEWYEELFSHGLPGGGAVIVTSRREDVIRRMVVGSDDDKHVIWVQPHLSDEICWQIFSKVLQQQRKMYLNHPKLSSIEDDVKRNFDGLPLAAKTFADILPHLLLKTTYWVRAQDLYIAYGDDASCWRWSSLPPPQEMEKVAEWVGGSLMYIGGRVELKELVMNTSYSAYLVFKLKTKDPRWEALAFVRIFNERSWLVEWEKERSVNLAREVMQRKGEEEQGWMEINLGHHIFTSNYLGHDDGDGRFFEATFIDYKLDAYLKSGVVVKGIEFRAH
ncbi:hypothetical protein C2S51_031723 [Perilla frutescens var. frutescens]|nr:hypothetical protein C2S51_031723 [Perilla frutescens var. frutescens]